MQGGAWLPWLDEHVEGLCWGSTRSKIPVFFQFSKKKLWHSTPSHPKTRLEWMFPVLFWMVYPSLLCWVLTPSSPFKVGMVVRWIIARETTFCWYYSAMLLTPLRCVKIRQSQDISVRCQCQVGLKGDFGHPLVSTGLYPIIETFHETPWECN